MKSLLAFLLGIGSVAAVSCNTFERMVHDESAEDSVTLAVTGMT